MFYIIISIVVFAAIAGIFGALHLYRVSVRNTKEMSLYSGDVAPMDKDPASVFASKRCLVIYYSLSGRTADISRRIQAKTGADIYEIRPVKEIKANPSLYLKGRSDIKKGIYPELTTDNIPDMGGYDIVFIGSPVWWYTASTPVLAFLDIVDFKGKKVVPFSTQGSNSGNFFEDFVKKAKNADVTGYLSFNNMDKEYDKAVDNKILVWLNGLVELFSLE